MTEFRNRRYLFTAVCAGNLAALSTGIVSTWSSPVLPKLTNSTRLKENPLEYVISNTEESWIGSMLALGAIFGPLLAGFTAGTIGRKYSLLFVCGVPFSISLLLLSFSKHIYLYYFARFVGGIAMGGVYTVLPMYNCEVAEASIRGGISSSMNVFVTSGQLFSYALGPYLSIMWFTIVCSIVPVLFLLSFFFVPESPYYLVGKDKVEKAEKSLRKFRMDSSLIVKEELEIIKLNVEDDKRKEGSFLDIIKSKALIKALIFTMTLMFCQQFCGVNAFLFYSESIFNSTGSKFPAEISSIIIGIVQVLASLVTPLIVDKYGRKKMFLISSIGMMVAHIPLGLFFYLTKSDKDFYLPKLFWLPITCLIVFFIFYNLGLGPLPWTVMGEIFPSNVKSAASTICAIFCWVLAFIILKNFSSVSAHFGEAATYWTLAGFCLFSAIFSWFFLIETKGKTFQEIQEELAR